MYFIYSLSASDIGYLCCHFVCAISFSPSPSVSFFLLLCVNHTREVAVADDAFVEEKKNHAIYVVVSLRWKGKFKKREFDTKCRNISKHLKIGIMHWQRAQPQVRGNDVVSNAYSDIQSEFGRYKNQISIRPTGVYVGTTRSRARQLCALNFRIARFNYRRAYTNLMTTAAAWQPKKMSIGETREKKACALSLVPMFATFDGHCACAIQFDGQRF